ncbi:MAG: hypothetical protein ACTHN0_12090 [Aquihabitans sp.]
MSGDDVDEVPDDAVDGTDGELWDGDDPAPQQGISPRALVIGAVAVLAVIVVLIAVSGSSDDSKDERATVRSTTTTVKRGPSWPAVVQGRPAAFGATGDPITKVDGEAKPGVYVWTDYDGWHAWVVDPSGKRAAKGTISSNQDFKSASVAESGQGSAKVDGQDVPFDFSGVDAKAAGVNFDLGFYADEVTVNLDGTDLPLYLGTEAKESPLPAVISKAVQPN